jgi:hypothetical protein
MSKLPMDGQEVSCWYLWYDIGVVI